MLRLTPPNFARLEQATSFDVVFGGGEANVAISLAHFGVPSAHVTRFPDNAIGRRATRYLREHGLDASVVLHGGQRIGVYFLEMGAALRASQIVYDRYNSAFSEIKPGMVDWESVLHGASWFHWAGITPALSQGAADVCLEAVRMAKKLGLTVSADIFYRSNLWQYGKTPQEILPELTRYTDLVVASPDAIQLIFGIENDSFPQACERLKKQFPTIRYVVDTHRTSVSASHNDLKGILWNGEAVLESDTFTIDPIIDRIGGGDAFIAGLIYGLMTFEDEQKTLNFATAASALKHTIPGDANLVSIAEVEAVMSGDVGGRLRR